MKAKDPKEKEKEKERERERERQAERERAAAHQAKLQLASSGIAQCATMLVAFVTARDLSEEVSAAFSVHVAIRFRFL